MKKTLFWAVVCTALLCGCESAEEIDERSFVMAAGIDKGDKGGIIFTAGCAVPDPYSDTTVKSTVLTREENTLAKAAEKNGEENSRGLYFGHIKSVVLGKDFLEDEKLIKQLFDFMERENDITPKTAVLYADGSAKECIEKTADMEESNNLYIWDYYKSSEENDSGSIRIDFDDMAKSMKINGACFIPQISVDDKKAVISGGCVLKDGKYLLELTQSQVQGYCLISERCEGRILERETEEGKVAAEIKKIDCTTEFFEKDNTLNCIFKIKLDADIKESSEGINEAEALAETAKEQVERLFYILKVNNADAFDMSDELRKESMSLYKKYGEENSFEKMIFSAECDVNILPDGLKN
jgi:Ger(x)C family germination protein